jgi:hypothetical protein
MTYREKTPVLCIYEYTGRQYGSTKRHIDSIMITVEFSDQILDEFERVMRKRVLLWHPDRNVGPCPVEWSLVSYQTPKGEANF